ncbi:MAG: hypothetical protein ACLTQP_01075 [Faecalibacterium prausnitzii]
MTIDASNRYGLAAATLDKVLQRATTTRARAHRFTPVTTRDRGAITMASMVKLKGTKPGRACHGAGANNQPLAEAIMG